MNDDWTIFVAISSGILSFITLVMRISDKAVSLREYEEFRKSIEQQLVELRSGTTVRLHVKTFDDWREQFRHDIEKLESDMHILEQTRPTTGELSGTLQAFENRLRMLENRLHDLSAQSKA